MILLIWSTLAESSDTPLFIWINLNVLSMIQGGGLREFGNNFVVIVLVIVRFVPSEWKVMLCFFFKVLWCLRDGWLVAVSVWVEFPLGGFWD